MHSLRSFSCQTPNSHVLTTLCREKMEKNNTTTLTTHINRNKRIFLFSYYYLATKCLRSSRVLRSPQYRVRQAESQTYCLWHQYTDWCFLFLNEWNQIAFPNTAVFECHCVKHFECHDNRNSEATTKLPIDFFWYIICLISRMYWCKSSILSVD